MLVNGKYCKVFVYIKEAKGKIEKRLNCFYLDC